MEEKIISLIDKYDNDPKLTWDRWYESIADIMGEFPKFPRNIIDVFTDAHKLYIELANDGFDFTAEEIDNPKFDKWVMVNGDLYDELCIHVGLLEEIKKINAINNDNIEIMFLTIFLYLKNEEINIIKNHGSRTTTSSRSILLGM